MPPRGRGPRRPREGALDAVGPAGIDDVALEDQLGATVLEAPEVLVTGLDRPRGVSDGRRRRLALRVVPRPADLHLPADLQQEVAVGGLEPEALLPADDRGIVLEGDPAVRIRQDVGHDAPDLLATGIVGPGAPFAFPPVGIDLGPKGVDLRLDARRRGIGRGHARGHGGTEAGERAGQDGQAGQDGRDWESHWESHWALSMQAGDR